MSQEKYIIRIIETEAQDIGLRKFIFKRLTQRL